MKGAKTIGVSFAKPKLKASKMSFVRAKKAQAIKAEDLKGPETVSTESLATTLTETNRILVEIQNQLAIDFANRIAEKKQILKLSRKTVRKKKLGEKEQFVERGVKLQKSANTFGEKVLKPIKSIFDRLIDFLTIVGGGIVLNAAWEWLQDEKNRENLIKVFTFLKTYWKEILIGILTAKVIGAIGKLVGFAKSLGKIFNRLKGLGRKPSGINPPKQTPADFCQQVLNCIQGGPVYNAIKNRLFEDPDFIRLIPGSPILPPTSTGQKPAEKPDDEPVSGDPPQIPVFNVQELMLKAPGTFTDAEKKFLDSQNLDFYKQGQTQTPGVDLAAIVALFAAIKTAPVWGPALLTQAGRLKNFFVKPNVVPQTQQALQQSASRNKLLDRER